MRYTMVRGRLGRGGGVQVGSFLSLLRWKGGAEGKGSGRWWASEGGSSSQAAFGLAGRAGARRRRRRLSRSHSAGRHGRPASEAHASLQRRDNAPANAPPPPCQLMLRILSSSEQLSHRRRLLLGQAKGFGRAARLTLSRPPSRLERLPVVLEQRVTLEQADENAGRLLAVVGVGARRLLVRVGARRREARLERGRERRRETVPGERVDERMRPGGRRIGRDGQQEGRQKEGRLAPDHQARIYGECGTVGARSAGEATFARYLQEECDAPDRPPLMTFQPQPSPLLRSSVATGFHLSAPERAYMARDRVSALERGMLGTSNEAGGVTSVVEMRASSVGKGLRLRN